MLRFLIRPMVREKSPFLDPFLQRAYFDFGQTWADGRHGPRCVCDASDDAGLHFRGAFEIIEADSSLAALLIRTVAREAALAKNRPHVALEIRCLGERSPEQER